MNGENRKNNYQVVYNKKIHEKVLFFSLENPFTPLKNRLSPKWTIWNITLGRFWAPLICKILFLVFTNASHEACRLLLSYAFKIRSLFD